MKVHAVLLVAAVLLISPAAAQTVGIDNPEESTPTTLYFHLDTLQDFPINTQPPDDRYAKGSTRGVQAPTTTCTPDASPGQIHQEQHTLYGVSTPGYVEYDFQQGGGPRTHPEKGIASDVQLDDSVQMMGKWYLKTTIDSGRLGGANPTGQGINDLPVAVPRVIVQFTMRAGDDLSFGDELYNSGEAIAIGQSAPMDLIANADVNPGYRPLPDGGHVYEFDIPMEIERAYIEAEDAFNVRVDMFMDIPGCNTDNDASLMMGSVEVYTAPEFRPRLDFAITNPIQLVFIHPQFIGNDLYIHTSINSPWGNYDVDEALDGVTVAIDGPTTASSVVRAKFTQRHHEHDLHFEPVDVTYVWPYKLDGAEAAEYTVTVAAWNDQRTAQAIGTVTIDVAKQTAIDTDGNEVVRETGGEGKGAPGFGLLSAIGLLAAAMFLRRRA